MTWSFPYGIVSLDWPFSVKVYHTRTDEVRQLLADGADVEERGEVWETTPLLGAFIEQRSAWTVLHVSAFWGSEEMTRLLLDHGADVSAEDKYGRTAEDLANANLHSRVVAMLRAETARREAVRRAQCVAFAMGQHERLGAGSRVRGLEPGVVRMVLEQV
ncbi:hypothetical protein T484DRAFT_1832942 [Baffinella frigidus]|nr:hypothetical protein T484DRAFT_1832942 [Cryptophyta sp. CCMP2293]